MEHEDESRSRNREERYVDIALNKGAKGAYLIDTEVLVREPRTFLICLRCPYKGWVCPPNILKPWEFYRLLDKYERHLLIHAPSDKISHEAALRVEKEAQKDGFYFAYALGNCFYMCNGRCRYLDGKDCAFPEKARPSMQSLGIDVVKTVFKLNLPLEVGSEEDWYSLVMLY